MTLQFELRDGTGIKGTVPDWAGVFSPTQNITGINGKVETTLIPDVSDCLTACASGSCQNTVVVVDQTGLFESLPLTILDAVP